MRRKQDRSGCPINLSMEVLGDPWSMIVLRDIIFGGRRHFRDLHLSSDEGIATNILANRLDHLVEWGLLTKHPDPTHKQRRIYHLTEASIELVPVMAAIGEWGSRWLPVTDSLAARARFLSEGGPELWRRFMDELRTEHLGETLRSGGGRPVREMLHEAYLTASSSD